MRPSLYALGPRNTGRTQATCGNETSQSGQADKADRLTKKRKDALRGHSSRAQAIIFAAGAKASRRQERALAHALGFGVCDSKILPREHTYVHTLRSGPAPYMDRCPIIFTWVEGENQ